MLNEATYFSQENQMKYMGASQFKAFTQCEAAALAEVRGEYTRPTSDAMLVGSYVDAHFDSTLDIFKAQHPELFRRDGALKADFKQADEIINRIERDEFFMMLMSGKKQVIRTGEIAGVPFKIKIDSLMDPQTCREMVKRFPDTEGFFGFCEGAIIDLKCMKDVAPIWVDGEGRMPFVMAWGYDIQGAVYQEIEGNNLPFALAVATKEQEAGLYAISIPQWDLDAKLMEVEGLAPRFQAIKQGKIEPDRCECCPYCRATRTLTGFIDYQDVGGFTEG